jgi:hypothetical protein
VIPPWSIMKVERSLTLWPDGKNIWKDCKTEVALAIKEGRLETQPCVVCGGTLRIERHHADYSKPFDVAFLCCRHHVQLHALLSRRFASLKPRKYTREFHDQVFDEFRRDCLQLELFSPPKKRQPKWGLEAFATEGAK